MANDTTGKTIMVAVILCIVCSVLVSTAAIKLKPLQQANKNAFTRTNILKSADLLEPGKSIDSLFEGIDVKYVDLATGEFVRESDQESSDIEKAVRDPDLKESIPKEKDLANIKSRMKLVEVYLVNNEGRLETIIIPVYGKGLWSTMYAFLALEADGNTIKGLSFYDHGETPGLGGEIENPNWLAQWEGKKIYNENGKLAFSIPKGNVNQENPEAIYQVDGISGATLTTTGVENMMHYWLGESGFKAFLSNMNKEGGENG